MRLSKLAVAITALVFLGACGSNDDDVSAVCVDPTTGVRVDDSQCGAGDGGLNGFYWFYIASQLNRPSFGTQVVHNTYYTNTATNPYATLRTPPADRPVVKNIPRSGATAGAKVGTKVNPPVKANSPQDKPPAGGGIKPKGVNPAPKPPAPAPPKVRTK